MWGIGSVICDQLGLPYWNDQCDQKQLAVWYNYRVLIADVDMAAHRLRIVVSIFKSAIAQSAHGFVRICS